MCLALVNIIVFLYFKEPYRLENIVYHNRIESSFPYLFDFISESKSIEYFILFHYVLTFIFTAMFMLIIPVINGTYNFFFKKILIFLILLMEVSFVCIVYSKYFLLEFAVNYWTRYTPFNYFLKQDNSLAASFVTLSYFFLIVFYLFLSFIFFYNIFFKRSPYLSFFSVIKSSFFIIIVCFLNFFLLCPLYTFLSCILTSYELKMKVIF